MAILEDEQRTLLIGVVAGVAATGVVKYVAPAFNGVGRPFLKGLVKTGLSTYERGREMFAEAGEVLEDLVAEARAELDAEARHAEDSHQADSQPEFTAASPTTPPATPPATNGGA